MYVTTMEEPVRGPSLGIVPVAVALWAGGAAAIAGATYWSTSDCKEWWCWRNIQRGISESVTGSSGYAPPSALPSESVPIAPVTEGEMTIPGAFTPEEVWKRTAQRGKDFRAGAQLPSQTGAPPSAEPDDDFTSLLILGVVAVGGLMLVMR